MTPDKLEEAAALIEASMASMAESLQALGVIEAGFAELTDWIKENKGMDIAPLVAALKGLKPAITINVPPAPAPQVHFLPAPATGTWDIFKPGAYGQPDVLLARVQRTA